MADSPERPNLTSQPTTSQTLPVRIHFPDRFLANPTHDGSSRSSSVSFTRPVQHMQQSRSDGKVATNVDGSGRRRVRSLGLDPIASGSKPSNKHPRRSGSRRKKNPTHSPSSVLSPLKFDSHTTEFEPSAFSDEYDLYPKILQDVQRALHLQSRRRERMSQQRHLTSDDVLSSSDVLANVNTTHASTSTAPPASHPSPPYLQVVNLPSEVDFSPSTRSVPTHPVPLSSNGGATLDWTGSQSEDEKLDKRWSISRGKHKTKETARAIVEKQESLFTDRISRIKAVTSPSTVRRAAIVSEQLGRRYNILYSSLSTGDPVALTQIARWHAGLETETQTWLASAEPLTWLKHLLDRRGKRPSQWHVSALVVEEFVKFKKRTASSTPPPQSSIASSSLETPSSQYLRPTIANVSANPSDSSPNTSSNQVRSPDGRIPSGPLVPSSLNTLGNSPSRSEGKARGWRHSFPVLFDSASGTGAPSPYPRSPTGGLSPASSRLGIPDLIHRFRRHPAESEECSSSPIGSQSEDQNDSLPIGHRKKSKRKDPVRLSEPQSPQQSASEIHTSINIPDVNVIAPPPANPLTALNSPSQETDALSAEDQANHISALPMPLRRKYSYRSTSLPLAPDVHLTLPESKDEPEGLEREYGLKSRTLDELKDHNHRLRHRMQRVAADVREYEHICSTVMPTLGIAYRSLPSELLDTLSHDPSAVTSGTRKRYGWRVVEDIHARVLRQRGILTNFLSGMQTDSDAVSLPENVLDKPISTLIEKLQALEAERGPLQQQADEVSRRLMEVRASHSIVKEEYNNALSYTSVVYPELSHIVALEESYRDQYQQIWELGMDALTVILDTIAPFWRSYGKIIGEDMQDFIIIPWYRNEFTGESKRYPVQSLPSRSLRHWLALICLGVVIFFVTFLQARAAITSAWNHRLLWIDNQALRWAIMPFFWVIILIQWFAFMFEVCVVLLNAAVVMWWLGWFVGLFT